MRSAVRFAVTQSVVAAFGRVRYVLVDDDSAVLERLDKVDDVRARPTCLKEQQTRLDVWYSIVVHTAVGKLVPTSVSCGHHTINMHSSVPIVSPYGCLPQNQKRN